MSNLSKTRSNLRHSSSKFCSPHSFLTVVFTRPCSPKLSIPYPKCLCSSLTSLILQNSAQNPSPGCVPPQDPSGLWVLSVCSVCTLGLPSTVLITLHCHFLLTHVCSAQGLDSKISLGGTEQMASLNQQLRKRSIPGTNVLILLPPTQEVCFHDGSRVLCEVVMTAWLQQPQQSRKYECVKQLVCRSSLKRPVPLGCEMLTCSGALKCSSGQQNQGAKGNVVRQAQGWSQRAWYLGLILSLISHVNLGKLLKWNSYVLACWGDHPSLPLSSQNKK